MTRTELARRRTRLHRRIRQAVARRRFEVTVYVPDPATGGGLAAEPEDALRR